MPYVTIDTSVEVDFWDVWEALSPRQQEEILDEINGEPEANEVSAMMYKIRYLNMYKDKSVLEILEMIAQNIATS